VTITTGSLRFRFLASSLVWIVICGVLAALLISEIFMRSVDRRYHAEMEEHVDQLAALTVLRPDGQPYLLRRLSDPRFLRPRSGMYWQVERPGFRTLASPSLEGARLDNRLASGPEGRFAWAEGPMGMALQYGRTVVPSGGGPPIKLLMASDRRLVDETLARFDRPLDLAIAGFAVLLLVGGALQLRFVLRPLGRLASDIGDVRAGRIQRMPEKYPDEIMPLVTDLNGLLQAQTELVARGRTLAGRLAHGLRTPLAAILDEAEQLQAAGHKGSAEVIQREIQRMTRQLDYHMARARSAGAARTTGNRTSLTATVEPVLMAMRRIHRERGIDFEMTAAPDLTVACDPVDLTEIVSNLLDNAGKWAASQCLVSWVRTGTMASILIDDDGKGIAPNLREQAFAVGERFDDDQPGSGLGLAIARDLARYYVGEVSLDQSPLGGLRARVTLGLASERLAQDDDKSMPQDPIPTSSLSH
jgi:signal transduction histidine kinase